MRYSQVHAGYFQTFICETENFTCIPVKGSAFCCTSQKLHNRFTVSIVTRAVFDYFWEQRTYPFLGLLIFKNGAGKKNIYFFNDLNFVKVLQCSKLLRKSAKPTRETIFCNVQFAFKLVLLIVFNKLFYSCIKRINS